MALVLRYFRLGLAFGMIVTFLCLRFSHLAILAGPSQKVALSKKSMTHKSLARPAENEPDVHLDLRLDEHHHQDDESVARELKNHVRVLIFVITSSKNLQTRAKTARDTWGRRCNKLIFFSSESNKGFPAVGLNVSEEHDHLVANTMTAFRYVYHKHFNDADWFMKVDDETYVIVENLRYFLLEQNSSLPIYFGHHFKTIVKQGYHSGGGYVLSKEALRRLATKGENPTVCSHLFGAEDIMLGHCMENLGVSAANSTDVMGRSRFHCFDPETHLLGVYPDWYYNYDANGAKKGLGNISDYAITFHNVSPQLMVSLEYYIYHLQPYGIRSGTQDLNQHEYRPTKKIGATEKIAVENLVD